jgi:hypothetical protein
MNARVCGCGRNLRPQRFKLLGRRLETSSRRAKNRTAVQFAVTVAFSAEFEPPEISAAEMESLKRFAAPETTPIHLAISAKKRDGLRIELSEWLSAKEHR